jgi:hypothetical protein
MHTIPAYRFIRARPHRLDGVHIWPDNVRLNHMTGFRIAASGNARHHCNDAAAVNGGWAVIDNVS